MLELKNVSAGYGDQKVLDNVSVSFEKGRLTAIIGKNGCGKSTLLKTALGLLPAGSGEVLVDGENIVKLKRNDIAKKVSYLSQGRNVPDMTVGQLVLHGRFPYLDYPRRYTMKDKEIAGNAMEKMGISHLADKPIYTLSGGMRQSAYIAMALAQDTDFIFLDEPTTYLDITNQIELMRNLRILAENGKGIITVLHDLPMAFNFSDEIVVMSDGRVVQSNTPSAIASCDAVYNLFGVKIKESDGNFNIDIFR